jgi:tetratricopeptide (TPR) repeat protein
MYLKALKLFPDNSSILLKYAGFIRHVKRDIGGSEEYYKKAINANPMNADAIGSYASFLHGVYNKKNEAEKLYEQALRIDDTHTNNLCNYGLYLRLNNLKVLNEPRLNIFIFDIIHRFVFFFVFMKFIFILF